MNLRVRFALFSLVFVGMLAGFFALVEGQVDQITLNRRHIEDDWAEVELLFDVSTELTLLHEMLDELPPAGDGESWQLWENEFGQRMDRLAGQLTRLRHHAERNVSGKAGERQELAALDRLDESLARLNRLSDSVVARRELDSSDRARMFETYASDLELLNLFFGGARQEFGDALETLDVTEERLNSALVDITLASLALLALAWVGFGYWMMRPLARLRRLVKQMHERDFDAEEPAEAGRHEIGELTRSFIEMAREIESFTDRLEQRVAERTRELEVSRRRVQTLLDRLPDAVGLVDAQGRPIAGNKPYFDMIESAGQSPFARPEKLARTPQGYVKWNGADSKRLLAVDRFPLDETEGVTAAEVTLEYIRDVTRQHEVETALAGSQRLASIGRLSAGIAHEINNPLTSIGACSEGLLKRLGTGAPDRELLRDYLVTIRDEVFRCKEITEKLLDVTRQREERFEEFNPCELIRDTARLAGPLAEKRGLRLETSLPATATLYSNPRALRQVILNLMMNAIEAGPPGGKIRVVANSDSDTLEIAVSDDGAGMDRETLEHLFEPFFTRRASGLGTGLGLFVCQSLIDAMGGEIRAASEGPGRGSTFTIRVPRWRKPSSASGEMAAPNFPEGTTR